MIEPLLHWPTAYDLAIDAAIAVSSLVPAIVFGFFYMHRLGVPIRLFRPIAPLVLRVVLTIAPRALIEFIIYLVALDCTRRDVHWVVIVAYVAWSIWGRKLPWDRWRKSLQSKASDLTEVTRAALKREQAEAFS